MEPKDVSFCRILIGLAECHRWETAARLSPEARADVTVRKRNLSQLIKVLGESRADTVASRNKAMFDYIDSQDAPNHAS